jgi:transposase-like protein
MQTLGCMRQQIAVLVDGAALDRNTVPNRRDRILQPRRAIDDEELGPPQATLDEIVDRAPSLWRLKHRPVADSLQEAGDRLFTFTRLPLGQWRSARTTNAIERLHEEFKRRIKTQTVLPSADTAAMLLWALLASGQISMRKIDGWHTLATKLIDQPIDLAA